MRTSASQFEVMVEYMEKHGDLSKPSEGPQGRLKNIQNWDNLTSVLNSDGTGDKKTAEKWRKVWSDLKNNTKRKAARYHRATVGTGGGPVTKIKLTDIEQRILSIIGPQAALGIIGVVEIGLNQDNPSREEVTPLNEVVQQGIGVERSINWSQPSTSSTTLPWLEPAAVLSASPAQPITIEPASPALPTTPPPPPPPQSSSTHATPKRRRLTARRRSFSRSPRASRRATQSELARAQFSRSDTEWRTFQREKARHTHEIEKERLRLREIELQQQARLREIELQQQARLHELFDQFLSIMRDVACKYINKND